MSTKELRFNGNKVYHSGDMPSAQEIGAVSAQELQEHTEDANIHTSTQDKQNLNNAYSHSIASHAPSNAQRNADITKAEIEAKLVGNITSHTHSGVYEPVITAKNTAFNVNFETTATNIKMDGVQSAGVLSTAARADHVHPVDTSRAAASHNHTGVYEPIITTKNSAYNVNFETNSANIKMDGTQSAGTLSTVAKADHVHPTDTTRAAASHTHGDSDITGIDAAKITKGTISIDRLPQSAIERLIVVANQAARYALTIDLAQNGDVVKQMDNGSLYYIVDDTKLNQALGYEVFSTGTASSVAWAGITGKPTTVSGYGITDASTVGHTHTKANITDFPTSLPANGGNADTVDGLHASSFAPSGFGIGEYCKQASGDWDNYNVSGFYMGSNLTNQPPAVTGSHTWWYVIVMQHNTLYTLQIATDFNNKATYKRVKNQGSWGSWVLMYTTDNKPSASDIGAAEKKWVNSNLREYKDVYSYTNDNSKVTGILKITLPVSWTSTMMSLDLDIYDYSSKGKSTYRLYGYNYLVNPSWINPSFTAVGSVPTSTVRFAHDGSKCCILIGATDTVWNYPKAIIRDVMTSFGSGGDNWDTGWDISFLTSETGLTNILAATNNSITPSSIGASDISHTHNTVGPYIGISNSANNNGYGISLYGGASASAPSYGLMFQGTATFGTHGAVTGDWATYFTMNGADTRGWIFRHSNSTNVASISSTGVITASDVKIGSNSVYHSGNKPTAADLGVAASSHNHTSLTGITQLVFNADATDGALIKTTIEGTNTYFDFELKDDIAQTDQWRWRFTPSGSSMFNAMVLNPVSTTKADLTVSGQIYANGGNLVYHAGNNPTSISTIDTRNDNPLPYEDVQTNLKKGMSYHLKLRNAVNMTTIGSGSYSGVMTLSPWNDSSGGHVHQLGFCDDGAIAHRNGTTAWGSWNKMVQSASVGRIHTSTASPTASDGADGDLWFVYS